MIDISHKTDHDNIEGEKGKVLKQNLDQNTVIKEEDQTK